MKWITSTDLKNWAPQRDCQENLPLLIRKLIRNEAMKITELSFPAGDNIVLSGWDGIAESTEETLKIPKGKSVWEIGCRKDFKKKIEEDFQTRCDNPRVLMPDTTYIAVTPYTWPDKDSWILDKKENNEWKDIRIYDGLELEEWIENNNVVGAWLAKYLEKTPDITPLDDFWDYWSNSSKYKISPKLVLSGRDSFSQDLIASLSSAPSVITIKSSTIEESIAFVGASVYENGCEFQEEILSRTAIIENETDFKSIISQRRPLILITKFEDAGIVDRAVRNGHHVIIPVGVDSTSSAHGTMILPRIKRTGFEEALLEMGFNREEAEKYTRDSGQSLSILRRLLQFVKNQQPDWAKNNSHLDLIPALIVGSWNEDYEGDKEVISRMAGMSYNQYISKLSKWKLHKDAPIIQLGSIWRITSALDAWSILAPFLLRKDYDQFKEIAINSLKETNPNLDLDPNIRYVSYGNEKKALYSFALKDGVCKSLVLCALYGNTFNNNIASAQNFVDSIIYEILNDASGKLWCSLNSHIPLIAEASPDIFLRETKRALISDNHEILEIFHEAKGVITSRSYHTGMLWGLESLASSSKYLLRVTSVLGLLAANDPGGQLSNRPIRSLREIYIPWVIQIDASIELMKTVLIKLYDEQPEVAWNLFISIMPDAHQTVHPINKSNWRFEEDVFGEGRTNAEVYELYSFLIDLMCEKANGNERRMVSLVPILDNIDNTQRKKIITLFNSSRDYIENTFTIWSSLRKFVSRHQAYSDMQWALKPDQLTIIRKITTLYEPENEILKSVHLFEDNWHELLETRKRRDLSYEEQQEILLGIRSKAVSSIYSEYGITGIFDLLEKIKSPRTLGNVFANISASKEHEIEILSTKSTSSSSRLEFKEGYIIYNVFKNGEEWINQSWKILNTDLFTLEDKLVFFLSLPQTTNTWNLLEGSDKELENSYWKKMTPWFYKSSKEERIYGFYKLQKANRHIIVLDTAAHFIEDLDSSTLCEILMNVATIPTGENIRLESYDVTKFFKEIKKRGDIDKQEIGKLEWQFLSFLKGSYSEYKPYILLEELTNNPTFFVDMCCIVYRPDVQHDDSVVKDLSEDEYKLRHNKISTAYDLLECWDQIPGMNADKQISFEILDAWIKNVRDIAKLKGHIKGVDLEIGKLLASYPRNNVAWPSEAICQIIDTLNSESLLDSFQTAIFNSRGTYSKSAYEGGEQERKLSSYFKRMADNIMSRWPFTASALENLSKNYGNDALREDESAIMDELRF